jgi:hypothetical protein
MKIINYWTVFFIVGLIGLSSGCSSVNRPLTVAQVPEADLYRVEQSQFDRFVIAAPEALAQYNKVMLFAMQFDRLEISGGANRALFDSWMASDWKQMDYLCQQFDDLAKKIFSESKNLKPTNIGDEDVLAVEFRLVRFHPYEKPYHQADRETVGTATNFEGLGEIEIQAVLANAKTGELVGVIEDGIVLSGGTYGLSRRNIDGQPDSSSRAAQNIAWRTAFRHWNTALHRELVALKTQ